MKVVEQVLCAVLTALSTMILAAYAITMINDPKAGDFHGWVNVVPIIVCILCLLYVGLRAALHECRTQCHREHWEEHQAAQEEIRRLRHLLKSLAV